MRAVLASLIPAAIVTSVASAQWTEVSQPGSFDHIQMFYAGSEALYAGSISGTVYASDDHGDSWAAIASVFSDDYAPVQSLARVGDVFVMGRASFEDLNFRSLRDGAVWGPWEPIVFQDATLSMLLVIGDTLFGTADGVLRRSDDAGLTWVEVALPGGDATWDIFTAGSALCAISGSDIHRSTDLGASWTSTTTPTGATQISSHVYREGELLVDVYHGAGIGSLWRSSDYGATWTEITTVPTTYNLTAMEIADDGRLVAGASSNGGGAGSIFFTSDYVTWDDYTADLPWFAQPVIDIHVHDGWLIKTGGSATPYHAPQPLVVDVADGMVGPGTPLALHASPNPARAGAPIRFELDVADLEPGTIVDFAVYDARGRRVATLDRGVVGEGTSTQVWDGRDAGGRRLSAGVYTVRVSTASGHVDEKVALIR